MRKLVAIVLMSILSLTSQASVIKLVKVAGLTFNYSVIDKGWITPTVKGFAINYKQPNKVRNTELFGLRSRVEADVVKKCEELGQIEFAEQRKKFSADYKVETSSKIESSISAAFDDKLRSSFVCNVEINASKIGL